MSKTKIDSKYVEVDGNGYRLTIIEERIPYVGKTRYDIYLSSTDTQFTSKCSFSTALEIQQGLERWIIDMDKLNNSKELIFTRLEEWDGVIEI